MEPPQDLPHDGCLVPGELLAGFTVENHELDFHRQGLAAASMTRRSMNRWRGRLVGTA
jgi:hypothetical protein